MLWEVRNGSVEHIGRMGNRVPCVDVSAGIGWVHVHFPLLQTASGTCAA